MYNYINDNLVITLAWLDEWKIQEIYACFQPFQMQQS